MKPTIESLWNGNIAPADNCGAGDPEIENLILLIERHRETLAAELGQGQRCVFEKYTDCMEEYVCLISMCAFRDGFSIAGRLMAEALAQE